MSNSSLSVGTENKPYFHRFNSKISRVRDHNVFVFEARLTCKTTIWVAFLCYTNIWKLPKYFGLCRKCWPVFLWICRVLFLGEMVRFIVDPPVASKCQFLNLRLLFIWNRPPVSMWLLIRLFTHRLFARRKSSRRERPFRSFFPAKTNVNRVWILKGVHIS